MKKFPIYLFSPSINYKTFYKVWSSFSAGSIVPMEMSKGTIVWEMIRDKRLYVYLNPSCKDDPICIGTKLPKNRKINLITNPKKR